jgi:N-methylhydantoinase A
MQQLDETFIVGIDIGGTFTDAAALSTPTGRLHTAKTPTTPSDLKVGLNAAVSSLAASAGLPVKDFLGRVTRLAHATTQTSNVMFTWTGSRVGLITTRGFRDELLIMRARGRVAGLSVTERRHLQQTSKPPFVVRPDRIVEVTERIDKNGGVVVELDEQDARRAIRALLARGVEAIAVCLLWSPANPKHEARIGELVRELAPSAHLSLSHLVAPVLGEYERAATTAVNAYVAPVVGEYLRSVEADLRLDGLERPLMIIQADGGSTVASAVMPVRTIESGPAAGMVAVKAVGDVLGEPNIVATDVGGTTFKVGLFVAGRWSVARETVVSQYTLALPMVDLISIGAGGGSIAWVDHGRLRVGPQSAAADPGPACYGIGGKRPTVTDADVVLGYIGTERLLGDKIRVRADLAWSAIEEEIAKPMFDGDVVAAAAAIRQIVDAQMSSLVRKATLERGHDPRQFVLMAYGGSGPVHAADYAAGLSIRRVAVPIAATVYSALGAAMSDIRYSLERPLNATLSASVGLSEAFAELEQRVTDTISRLDVASRIELEYWVDVRYERQLHSIRIQLDRHDLTEDAVRSGFLREYAELYGSSALLPGAEVRLLRVGIDGIGLIDKFELPTIGQSGAESESGHRKVFWPRTAEWLNTAIVNGERLGVDSEIAGPALVDFPGTTAAIPDGARARITSAGVLMIELEDAE